MRRAVAITHGHEAGWAALPGARQLLRRIGDGHRRRDLPGRVLPRPARRRAHGAGGRADGPAGARAWTPTRSARTGRPRGASGTATASADRPVVVCVSRLVPRKGQDTLIRALPAVRRRVPGRRAADRRRRARTRGTLARWREQAGVGGSVRLHRLGAVGRAARALRGRRRVRDAVPHPARRPGRGGPRHRLPGGVRDRPAGGRRRLGRRAGRGPARARPATWSAAATSGRLADRLIALLPDPAGARAMGEAGRAWVERDWRWDIIAARLRALIDG